MIVILSAFGYDITEKSDLFVPVLAVDFFLESFVFCSESLYFCLSTLDFAF
jgi:hypothetical protein